MSASSPEPDPIGSPDSGTQGPSQVTGASGPSQVTGASGPSQATGAPGPSQVTGASGPSQATGAPVPSTIAGALRTTKRSQSELRSHGGLFDEDVVKQKYATRGTKECMQWIVAVTSGIDSKFSTVKSDSIDDEQFESVYDLSMRVAELKTFVKQNGLISAFDIYDIDSNGMPLLASSRNLLDDYGTLTLDTVKASTRSIQEWASDHKVWAETIVMQLVSNSCDSDLRQRVTERLIDVNDYEVGGATFFKIALECITSMSHTVSMSLSIKITNLTIKKFDGENVIKVISSLRGATQRLTMSGMLPPHLPIILYRIFQSSSCVQFNNFFAALYAREEADVILYGPHRRLPAETLFRVAEHQYRTMLEDGTWTVVGKKPSAFNTEGKGEGKGDDSKPLPPWKTPPKESEPHEREFRGRNEFWCTKCGWNRTHLTPKHQSKGALKTAREKSNATVLTTPTVPAAAVTAAATTPTVSFAPADAATPPVAPASSNASFLMTGMRS
jgi:hypothetical protein